MEIIKSKIINLKEHGKNSLCTVFCLHIKVKNIKSRAEAIIKAIKDTSWIEKLDDVGKIAYEARARRTIDDLVDNIFKKVEDSVTSEFGEYLVTETARTALNESLNHEIVPLAELWKEKLSGNPGFDFHTITQMNLIAFGESKYSATDNPHGTAMEQMGEMIDIGKDAMDLAHLRNFIDNLPIENYQNGNKAFIASFSLNSTNYDLIFKNAINSKFIDKLLGYNELYLIGVEVC